jgi:hypothetical protein
LFERVRYTLGTHYTLKCCALYTLFALQLHSPFLIHYVTTQRRRRISYTEAATI